MALYKVPEGLQYLGVQDFKSVADKYDGLAKSNRYTVFIKLGSNFLYRMGYQPIINEFSYLCESTELPGRGFMHAEPRLYGPTYKIPFQTSYEDITFTFLCRNKHVERQLFDDWMETINPSSSYDFNYKDEYCCEIDIFTYGEAENGLMATAPAAEYCFTLRKAFPILVNPQPVTWADDNFQRLGVTFTYEKWVRVNRDRASNKYTLVKNRSSDI